VFVPFSRSFLLPLESVQEWHPRAPFILCCVDICPFLLVVAKFGHGEPAGFFCACDLVYWINVFLYLNLFQRFRLVLKGLVTLLRARIKSSPEIIEQFGFRFRPGERANSNPIFDSVKSWNLEMDACKVIPWWSSV